MQPSYSHFLLGILESCLPQYFLQRRQGSESTIRLFICPPASRKLKMCEIGTILEIDFMHADEKDMLKLGTRAREHLKEESRERESLV